MKRLSFFLLGKACYIKKTSDGVERIKAFNITFVYDFPFADYDYALLKPIPSKYTVGKGFLDKWTPDGKTTNVSLGIFILNSQ